MKQPPYLVFKKRITVTEKHWNPTYPQKRLCQCDHPYHRHFDSYEDMKNVGCKYCECIEFKERKK